LKHSSPASALDSPHVHGQPAAAGPSAAVQRKQHIAPRKRALHPMCTEGSRHLAQSRSVNVQVDDGLGKRKGGRCRRMHIAFTEGLEHVVVLLSAHSGCATKCGPAMEQRVSRQHCNETFIYPLICRPVRRHSDAFYLLVCGSGSMIHMCHRCRRGLGLTQVGRGF